MPIAIDTNSLTSTSTGAGNFIAATNFTNDINQIRNFSDPGKAFLLGFGRKGATVGTARMRSGLMHDDVQAIRLRALPADPTDHMLDDCLQAFYAQDTLTIDGDGTNTEVEAYWYQVFYSDLKGGAARLHMLGDVQPLIQQIEAQQLATIATVAPPNYATAAVTSLYNATKANRDYAVLGYQVDAVCNLIAIQGQDTSNLKIGGPGILDIYKTRDYFVRMSKETGLPCIPVINAANMPGTNVLVSNDLAAVNVNVTLILGLLSSNITP